MLAGLFFVGLGIIGVFLPVMPSTVFFIIAAVFFARSNPAWEARIMNHPKIGPPIAAFRQRGVIGPKAKWAAVLGMGISSLIGLFTLPGIWAFVPLVICTLSALYVLSRPSY